MKGKFIVIDGTDGAGKATQTRLLIKRLQKAGYRVKVEDFPQYGKKSAGPVEDYLTGVYGTAKELGAYIPSIFYAVDRFAASERIRRHLNQGYVVVSNRYVTANMAHQGGKIKNPKVRVKFFKWLLDLEYNFFQIPKPDLEIILHLPPEVSLKLIRQRGPKYYIGYKKRDLHEIDINHLKDAEKVYLAIAKKLDHQVVEGMEGKTLLSHEQINEKVLHIVKKYLQKRK